MVKSMPLYLKDGRPLWTASGQLNASGGFVGSARVLSTKRKR